MPVLGLHHVTCIAGDPQENLDFYAGVLGMRLVKRSVNQDDPGTYHLFYADGAGRPGSDLTFFPWPHMAPGRPGVGLTTEVALAVPPDSLAFWRRRLAEAVRVGEVSTRFGERVLAVTDPHGLPLVLVEADPGREFTPWPASPIPEDKQVRRIHAVRILEHSVELIAETLTDVLGYRAAGDDDGWRRYAVGDGASGCVLDVRAAPDLPRGRWGLGSVHHVAYRVPDDETQARARTDALEVGLRPTSVIDRFWFRSVYFQEPGGALFELATDGPGFGVDEDPARLGERLVLPPWLEPDRKTIEAGLPALRLAVRSGTG